MKNHVIVLFVFVALFGAACSADVVSPTTSQVAADTESSSVEDPVSSTASSTESEVEPEATEATAAPETATQAEPVEAAAVEQDQEPAAVETASAASLLGSDDWCTVAGQIENILDPDDLSDAAALEESYTTATVMIAEAVRIAPPAIASDVAAMAQGAGAFSALLAEAEWDFLDVDLAAMEEIAVSMDGPGDNIERYNFEVCGIGQDPGDDYELDSDDFDEPLPEGTARDLIIENLVTSGFTEAEAACLLEALDFTNPDVMGDPAAMVAVFGDCGISIDRLSQLGG